MAVPLAGVAYAESIAAPQQTTEVSVAWFISAPKPVTAVIPPPPPSPPHILLENGDDVLLETGGLILLE